MNTTPTNTLPNTPTDTVDFGYTQVPRAEKTSRVGAVFRSVANRYDMMNDLMSAGLHRIWKDYAVGVLGLETISSGRVLDLAGGTGDLTLRIAKHIPDNQITLADINADMLTVAKRRLAQKSLFGVTISEANAEALPFADNYFSRIIIGFGLRNITDKAKALTEMHRVLAPGGKAVILEFSHVRPAHLAKLYDAYSFNILPTLGAWVANDRTSYQYLAESIRKHPDQETLKRMMMTAGFTSCHYENLNYGVVALHSGYKPSA